MLLTGPSCGGLGKPTTSAWASTKTSPRRPSAQTVAVLQALSSQPMTWRYGYELVSRLGISSGSLYPILMRLTDRGMLEADWETDGRPGRPARHLYRITATGLDFVVAGRRGAVPATMEPAHGCHRRRWAARRAIAP